MARTFRDDLTDELLGNQLNADEFGEEAVYHAANGEVRLIRCQITRSDEYTFASQMGRLEAKIIVLVAKDDLRGISVPQIEDWIERTGEHRNYNFSGRVLSEDAASWRLEYQAMSVSEIRDAGHTN